MSDITPGVWLVHDEEPGGDGAEVWALKAPGERRHVASHIGAADARLISAAPHLLLALEALCEMLDSASEVGALYGRCDVEWNVLRDGVKDVIQQAKGTGQQ